MVLDIIRFANTHAKPLIKKDKNCIVKRYIHCRYLLKLEQYGKNFYYRFMKQVMKSSAWSTPKLK